MKNEVVKQMIADYLSNPDKYVYPFVIEEKNGKQRTIITYNKYGVYGGKLRVAHEEITESFHNNFSQRNINSYAYHKNVRCFDALQCHLKSNFFIKLDVHHFFESITQEKFLEEYGEYFNDNWVHLIRGLFYKGSLSIGFVSSPVISDFYMKKFDNEVEEYLKKHQELHYSRYSDDILLSSESDNGETLNDLFQFIIEAFKKYGLEINDKKTRKIRLDYQKHNSISYLGLNLSKQDEVNNKVTISKRYILFLLKLIAKQKGYTDHCYPLENEIKSRVAYLAYNSPISYRRFQEKHIRIYGEPYMFTPKVLENRSVSNVVNEIPNFDEYSKIFKINIHKKVTGSEMGGFQIKDAIEVESYLGRDKEVVEIPYFVDSIGQRAFFGHTEIKKVVLNKKIKVINDTAFQSCSNLSEIELPDSLRYIGHSAFSYCSSLKSIVIPEKVKRISSNSFYFSGLTSLDIKEGVQVICCDAFSNTAIESLVLPDSVLEIGNNAFYNCQSLSTVNFASSKLETIGEWAFAKCNRLANVKLSNSTIRIGKFAFASCLVLNNVFISASVLEIGAQVFSGCPNLTSIEIDSGNRVFDHRSDNASIIETATRKLIFTLKETIDNDIKVLGRNLFEGSLMSSITIPEGVVEIENSAFNNCTLLKKVTLPSSITTLGSSVFSNCISLKEITIPEGIKKIPSEAFANCRNLERVNMSEEVIEIGSNAFLNDASLHIKLPRETTSIGECAFKNCLNNKELFIPAKVKKIKKNAFLGLSKVLDKIVVDPLNITFTSGSDANVICVLKKLNILVGCKNSKIEQGVRSINKYAFAYSDIKDVSFPNTLKIVAKGAFYKCEKLENLDLNIVNIIEESAFEGATSLKNLTLPNSLIKIGTKAFKGSGITSIDIPNSVTSIEKEAFATCKSLVDINISSTGKFDIGAIFYLSNKVTRISVCKDSPYYDSRNNCNAIIDTEGNTLVFGSASTIIPNSVEAIDQLAFANNELLTEIVIPASVKYIGRGAFKNCKNLKRVEICGEIEFIPTEFANGCISLEEVIIPSSVTKIGSHSFYLCSNLKSIKLPSELEEIASYAFMNSGLEMIDIPSSVNKLGSYVLSRCERLASVRLSNSLTSIPQSAFNMTSIQEIVVPEGVESINGDAFADCKLLRCVTLPNSLKRICSRSFARCEALEGMIIPESTLDIYDGAFNKCENLKSVALPSGLVAIESNVFQGCSSLETINFPAGLKIINDSAFAECYNLVVPKFPDTLEVINNCAFKDNKSLKNILLPKSLKMLSSTSFFNCDIEHITVSEENEILFDEGKDAVMFVNDYGVKCLLIGTKNTVIPDDVEIICNAAFANNESITDLKLPSKLRKICDSAFINSINLRNVEFPEKLEIIDKNAFCLCKDIKHLQLNKNLVKVATGAFRGLSLEKISIGEKLESIDLSEVSFDEIEVDKNNQYYTTYDCNVLASNGDVLYTGKEAKIPDGIKSISSNCYYGQTMKKIVLPESLVSLGTPFANYGIVEDLYIPKNLMKLSGSFGLGTYFKKIVVDKDSPYFVTNEDNTILFNKNKRSLFYCANEAIIPEGVAGLACSFARDNISRVYIPSSLSTLPTSIYPNRVIEYVVSEDNPYFESIDNAVLAKKDNTLLFLAHDAKIPEKTTQIGPNALALRKDIKSLFIPKNVRFIDKAAFREMENIESIVVDKDNPVFDSRDNCNAIIITALNIAILTCENTKLPEGVIDAYTKEKIAVAEKPYGKFGYRNGATNISFKELSFDPNQKPIKRQEEQKIDGYLIVDDNDMPF